jgi:REP element-mobilizing transposase RayT
VTYLITFSTYGSHLHGDERGSVDRNHNVVGAPLLEPSITWRNAERQSMEQAPYVLDESRRSIVLQAVVETCLHRDWGILAVHVRTTHIHVVVQTDATPDFAAITFKRFASRALNHVAIDPPNRKRWSRGESTRTLASRSAVERAIRYVIEEQGELMEMFVAK